MRWGRVLAQGLQKVRCGVLQPRLPSQGLRCLLSSIRVQLAIECPIGSLCCSLTSLAWARGVGLRKEGEGGVSKLYIIGCATG